MTLFVELSDENEPSEPSEPSSKNKAEDQLDSVWPEGLEKGASRSYDQSGNVPNGGVSGQEVLGSTQNANRSDLTEAMGSYPIISTLVGLIDLNTLDALSMTCKQVRANLIQYKRLLIRQTLRCENEEVQLTLGHGVRHRARAQDWYFVEEGSGNNIEKAARCARDLVEDCRRCGSIVCRNCTIKPPAPILLQYRHRRLCPSCIATPLDDLVLSSSSPTSSTSTSPSLTPTRTPPRSSGKASSVSSSVSSKDISHKYPPLLAQSTCKCPSSVHLCQPCGRSIRSSDNTYQSIWRWRLLYGEKLGGLGTGIGEGDRSFECGRGKDCVAAQWVEEVVDCDAEDARDNEASTINSSWVSGGSFVERAAGFGFGVGGERRSSGSSLGDSFPGSRAVGGNQQLGPGYARHEIEGIGGIVKTKLVRMVRVGACVTKFDDESEAGRYLVREVEGSCRSFCGWCFRIIPGVRDLELMK